jgi:hypothetical protein
MAKKSKIQQGGNGEGAAAKKRAPKKAPAPLKRRAPDGGKKAAGRKAVGKKRSATHLALPLPLARARKLAGDLYESAGLALWAEAIEKAPEPERATLIQLQDAICEAADLLKSAKATNPKHLHVYLVACFDRDDLPITPPSFVTAASDEEALKIWRAAFKGTYGRRKPKARLVPALGETPGLLA